MSSCSTYNPFAVKAPTLKVILVAKGDVHCLSKIQKMAIGENYQTIAIDGGYDTIAKTGLRPVFSIGDFDSTNYDPEEIRYNSEELIELPQKKDKTDFEEALEETFYRGFTHLAIFGILGGSRIEFGLNNLLVLSKYAAEERQIDVYSPDGKTVMRLLGEGGSLTIDDIKNLDMNYPLSVIPVKESSVSIKNMEYDHEGTLDPTSSLSMSNKAKKGGVIKVNSGVVYVSFGLLN